MNYQQTVEWMFGRLPMFQTQGRKALNHKLDNIIAFTKYLKNPQQTFRSVHIAGTNGKGSSSHMIASVLQQAGYKVGLYTSPHLRDYRERIKINGVEIPEETVVQFIEKNKIFLEKHNLSFFEMTVGLAFDYFATQAVDIAIIEVGLGGRYDSTNIISPEVALITNISKDHTDILGDSLSEIAQEKAGIIKPFVPVVISEYHPETEKTFVKIAQAKQAPILFANNISTQYSTDLKGEYQSKNIKGVVAVLDFLRHKGWQITQEDIIEGLNNVVKHTNLKGRWQELGKKPKIICDTAHNEAGIALVISQIEKENYHHLRIVLGFVKDKNIEKILDLFPKNATYYFCQPNIPRGLDAILLEKIAHQKGLKGQRFASVSQALSQAQSDALPNDFIYVGGSTFVVAEVV